MLKLGQAQTDASEVDWTAAKVRRIHSERSVGRILIECTRCQAQARTGYSGPGCYDMLFLGKRNYQPTSSPLLARLFPSGNFIL